MPFDAVKFAEFKDKKKKSGFDPVSFSKFKQERKKKEAEKPSSGFPVLPGTDMLTLPFKHGKDTIVEDIPKGMASGVQQTLAYGLGGVTEAVGEKIGQEPSFYKFLPKSIVERQRRVVEPTRQAIGEWVKERGTIAKEFYKQKAETGWEAPDPEIMKAKVGEKNYGRKLAYMVGSSAPQMIAAMGITYATKNPVLGASIFGPQAFGGFYSEARDAGVPVDKAFNLALVSALAQMGLEVIPMTGWLKGGGGILKRIGRGMLQEGLIEEGSQQIVENALKKYGWAGDELSIWEGFEDSVIVGSIMGAGMGATPSSTTFEDVKVGWKDNLAKSLRKQAVQKKMNPFSPEVQEVVDYAKSNIDKISEKQYMGMVEKVFSEFTELGRALNKSKPTGPKASVKTEQPIPPGVSVPPSATQSELIYPPYKFTGVGTPDMEVSYLTPEQQAQIDVINRTPEAELQPQPTGEGKVPDFITLQIGDKKIEVIKNPTGGDYEYFNEQFVKKYPNAPKGEPKTRFAYDAEGNRYVWSSDTTHDDVQRLFKSKYGLEINQNPSQLSQPQPTVEAPVFHPEPSETVLISASKQHENVPIVRALSNMKKKDYAEFVMAVEGLQRSQFPDVQIDRGSKSIGMGKWQEDSMSFYATGPRTRIKAFKAKIGKQFGQDAVIGIKYDTMSTASIYEVSFVKPLSQKQLRMISNKISGLFEGGHLRVKDGKIIIASRHPKGMAIKELDNFIDKKIYPKGFFPAKPEQAPFEIKRLWGAIDLTTKEQYDILIARGEQYANQRRNARGIRGIQEQRIGVYNKAPFAFSEEVLGTISPERKSRGFSPPTEVHAGVPSSKFITKVADNLKRKFDVEYPLKQINAPQTGLAMKTMMSKIAAGQERILKNLEELQKFNLSPEEYTKLAYAAQYPESQLTPDTIKRLGPAHKYIRQFFDNYFKLLNRRLPQKFELPFPQSHIRRMLEENKQLEASLPRIKNFNKQQKVAQQIKENRELIELYRSKQIKFVHIPIRLWMGDLLDKNPGMARKMLGGSFRQIVGRETPTLEHFVQAGLVAKEDVDIRDIIASYGNYVEKQFAHLDILEMAKAEGVAKTTPVEDWVKLPASIAPSLEGYHLHPGFAEVLERFFKASEGSGVIGKIMAAVKMMQFYNPLFLPMYDTIQAGMLGALKSPKYPLFVAKAIKDVATKSENYFYASKEGLFSKPFANPFDSFMRQVNDIKTRQNNGNLILSALKKLPSYVNPVNVIRDVYNASWNVAWTLDAVSRMASREWLLASGELTSLEASQLAAKFHSDYASIPPQTRRVLNKIFFTPTFEIAMNKLYGEMLKNAVSGKAFTGTVPEQRYAKGLLYTAAILFGKDAFMYYGLGFEREQFSRRYYKQVDTEDGPKEAVMVFSNPANIWHRYYHKYKYDEAHSNYLMRALKTVEYRLHPTYRTALDVINNEGDDFRPVYNPFSKPHEIVLDIMKYTLGKSIRISEGFVRGEDVQTKKTQAAMRKAAGDVWANVLRPFTFRYVRDIKDVRKGYQVNRLVKDFEQLITRDPSMSEEEILRSQENLIKRIERIQEKQ